MGRVDECFCDNDPVSCRVHTFQSYEGASQGTVAHLPESVDLEDFDIIYGTRARDNKWPFLCWSGRGIG